LDHAAPIVPFFTCGYRRHEAEQGPEELRTTFRRKAHTAAMERFLTGLLRACPHRPVQELGTVTLGDLPAGRATEALLRRRAALGLPDRGRCPRHGRPRRPRLPARRSAAGAAPRAVDADLDRRQRPLLSRPAPDPLLRGGQGRAPAHRTRPLLVIGAGGLGHIGIEVLKALTPAEIIVVDRNPDAVNLALSIGADHGVVAEGGATREGIRMLRSAGDYHVVGYGENIDVPTIGIISSEINIVGNLVGSYNDLCELMVLAARGAVRLHTVKYSLDDFQSAINDLDAGLVRGPAILVP
jgi:hypothetical protein